MQPVTKIYIYEIENILTIYKSKKSAFLFKNKICLIVHKNIYDKMCKAFYTILSCIYFEFM